MKCFFHSADLDGHCSGAIVKMFFPECEMIGINYGDEFPWGRIKEDNDKIYMVDFSLQPFSNMVNLWKKSDGRLIWIDHHKSTIEEHEKWNKEHKEYVYIDGIRKDGIGACQLVWEWLYKVDKTIPTFIKLIAEYDVWNHIDPRTLPFQYGLRQYDTFPTSEKNMEFWFSLFDVEMVNRIIDEGSIIIKYEDELNRKYVSSCAFETEIEGYKCIAVNKMLTSSRVFESIWDNSKYDMMLTFGRRKGFWTVSLYTDKEGVDVSVVAKKHGGGGHKQAAGFQCDVLPFET